MKKTTLLILVLALCNFTSLFAQYKQTVVSVSEDEIPTEIKKVHELKYPAAFNTQWHKKEIGYLNGDKEVFVVTFKMDGRVGHKAFYNKIQGYLAYVGFIDQSDLPETVQLKAQAHLKDDYIKHGQIIQLEEPYIFLYRVKVNNTGLLEYFYFDKYGNPLDKKNLSPKVFAFI